MAWLIVIAAFAADWLAMGRQWWNISTYNHILLVPFIIGWLVWQRWPQLRRLEPSGWWPGAGLFAAAAFFWLLGAVSGTDIVRQAGAVAMLAACVPLVLGPRLAWALLFPLCYMAFLVPVGEELVKVLQTVTAVITIALTQWSGIPADIAGVFIDTPAGLFEVAEACSGVKFLIAMVAFGVLAAHVCFRGWPRRLAIVATCIVVPILANGVRAWGTIYMAQIVGVEAAAGFDHIIYGWVFFAVVIALIIALFWRHFDRPLDDPFIDASAIAALPWIARLERLSFPVWAALGAVALAVAGVVGWAHVADSLRAPLPARIDLPGVTGWTRVDYAPQVWWEPRARGADHRLLGRYRNAQGQEVDVFVALYASQGEGRDAGGFGQGALVPDSPWSWQADSAPVGGGRSEQLLGHGRVERLAVTWYRNGQLMTGSNLRLKLALMADRLAFRAEPTATLILSAEDNPRGRAAASVQAFMASVGPLDAWMDRMTEVR